MLSVEVSAAQQHFTVNVFTSELPNSEQNLANFSDREIRSSKSFADERIVRIIKKENTCNGSLDDQSLPHNPIQCCSPIVDGELVITTNQTIKWLCFSHSSVMCQHSREDVAAGCVLEDHLCKHSESMMGCVPSCRDYQPSKQSILSTVQIDSIFNINCTAVQESVAT